MGTFNVGTPRQARKGLTWYQNGFDEARRGLPADPPYEPGNVNHANYLAGYADGERQQQERTD